MKKKTVYWLPKLGVLAVLSMLFMLSSAIARIVWSCGETQLPASVFWFQVVLPLVANLSFIPIVLRDGRERFYRTAIPVWMGCVFFAAKALTFPSRLHMVLCLGLYLLVLVLYTATVTGYVPSQVPLWFLFGLPMLYHVFVEDAQKEWTLHTFLPELSVLCCMVSLLLISLAMRKKTLAEGEEVLQFGDRNDGRRLRTLSPIFAVSPYLMKTRNTSQNYIADEIEITEMERYIQEKRQSGWKNFGILHVLLAGYIRACARYPGLNRFVAGQKIFARGREIEVNMTIKKTMSTDSPDTVIKVVFDPADTAQQVYERFNAKVQEVKDAPLDSGFDHLAKVFNWVPGLLLKFLVALLQTMDYFGLLPRFLTRLSPFHGSLYITSMASLGIPPIYHHLYDFGNVPVFVSFGKKRREVETRRDGTVVQRKYIDWNIVTDERIVDGFYYASVIRYLHNLYADPWQLDQAPAVVLRDQD